MPRIRPIEDDLAVKMFRQLNISWNRRCQQCFELIMQAQYSMHCDIWLPLHGEQQHIYASIQNPNWKENSNAKDYGSRLQYLIGVFACKELTELSTRYENEHSKLKIMGVPTHQPLPIVILKGIRHSLYANGIKLNVRFRSDLWERILLFWKADCWCESIENWSVSRPFLHLNIKHFFSSPALIYSYWMLSASIPNTVWKERELSNSSVTGNAVGV